jgi:hypothetical protein
MEFFFEISTVLPTEMDKNHCRHRNLGATGMTLNPAQFLGTLMETPTWFRFCVPQMLGEAGHEE